MLSSVPRPPHYHLRSYQSQCPRTSPRRLMMMRMMMSSVNRTRRHHFPSAAACFRLQTLSLSPRRATHVVEPSHRRRPGTLSLQDLLRGDESSGSSSGCRSSGNMCAEPSHRVEVVVQFPQRSPHQRVGGAIAPASSTVSAGSKIALPIHPVRALRCLPASTCARRNSGAALLVAGATAARRAPPSHSRYSVSCASQHAGCYASDPLR